MNCNIEAFALSLRTKPGPADWRDRTIWLHLYSVHYTSVRYDEVELLRALTMSRNGSPAPRKATPSHLRQFSRTSLEKLAVAPQLRSPDAMPGNPDIAVHDPAQMRPAQRERTCTVTVNESFTRDEVLMNLDLFGDDIKPGTLMDMRILVDKPGHASLRKLPPRREQGSDAAASVDGVQAETDARRRYLFVVKDMSKEMRARHPTVELYVAKHVADAFGMKRGSTALLAPVSLPRPPPSFIVPDRASSQSSRWMRKTLRWKPLM